MTQICPACSYIRKPTDSVPEWQCPSCQKAYNKAGGPEVSANYGRYGPPVVQRNSSNSGGALKWLLVAVVLGVAFVVARPMWHEKKPVAIQSATNQPTVILYGTEWCGYCTAARKFFAANGIQYTNLDVEKTTEGYEGHKKLGGRGYPLIVVGDQVISGYNEGELRSSLHGWLKGT